MTQQEFWQKWTRWRHGDQGTGSFADVMAVLGMPESFARFVATVAIDGNADAKPEQVAVVDLACGSGGLAPMLSVSLAHRGARLAAYTGVDNADPTWVLPRVERAIRCCGLDEHRGFLHHDLSLGLPADLPVHLADADADLLVFTSSFGITYLEQGALDRLICQAAQLAGELDLPALLCVNMLTTGHFDRRILTRRFLTEIVPQQLGGAWRNRSPRNLIALSRAFRALPRMRAFGTELTQVVHPMPVSDFLTRIERLGLAAHATDDRLLWGQTTCVGTRLGAAK